MVESNLKRREICAAWSFTSNLMIGIFDTEIFKARNHWIERKRIDINNCCSSVKKRSDLLSFLVHCISDLFAIEWHMRNRRKPIFSVVFFGLRNISPLNISVGWTSFTINFSLWCAKNNLALHSKIKGVERAEHAITEIIRVSLRKERWDFLPMESFWA